MNRVTHLKPVEEVSLDQDRLAVLYTSLDQAHADDIIVRALEQLAKRLAATERAYRREDFAAVERLSQGVAAIAEQVGMLDLAQGALAVRSCVKTGDAIGAAATLARMSRLGNQSLGEICDRALVRV